MNESPVTYYVDEAGDGVLFGPKGRSRLDDPDSPRFFMLGMVRCGNDEAAAAELEALRMRLCQNPLYADIPSMQPEEKKTALHFHAKDDHPEIRAKVFESLVDLDFQFSAVIKDMRKVLQYVRDRNLMDSAYQYHPSELYDFTARMLFKSRLHKESAYRITFARRGKSDRTRALKKQLLAARQRFLREHQKDPEPPSLQITPAYPREAVCLQIADYALWALQRCYERHEARFLRAIWSKVSLIIDADDPDGKKYGTYHTRKSAPPDPRTIKNRRI